MKLLVLCLLFVSVALSQTTVPTLPAVQTITTPTQVCAIEVIDDKGTLYFDCKDSTTGGILTASNVTPSDAGTLFGHGPALCLYWVEDAATSKWRLQCGDTIRVVVDGYTPKVTKKRKWSFPLWR